MSKLWKSDDKRSNTNKKIPKRIKLFVSLVLKDVHKYIYHVSEIYIYTSIICLLIILLWKNNTDFALP
jgi:hypothetical protein